MGRQDWDWEKILSRLINNLSEKTYWDNIYELRRRGTEIVFDRLRELASKGNAKERMIAVDVLSQLDMPLSKEEYSKRVVDFFFLLLKKEENEAVQKSILFGLGHNNQHLNSNELISFISNFKNNKSVKIREGVVFAFLGLNNDLAIETLIQLSQDKLSRIRSWATFGIGSMVDRSDQLIIDNLLVRSKDKHEETRLEAIVGLAKRENHLVVKLIEKELSNSNFGVLVFDAIIELNNTCFLPFLEKMSVEVKDETNINEYWLKALVKCIDMLKKV